MSIKYQKQPDHVFAEQFTGSNQAAMLSFAPDFLYLAEGNVLMQKGNPFPLVATEWVLQYRNTNNKGDFFRQTDDIFQLTWAVGGP